MSINTNNQIGTTPHTTQVDSFIQTMNNSLDKMDALIKEIKKQQGELFIKKYSCESTSTISPITSTRKRTYTMMIS